VFGFWLKYAQARQAKIWHLSSFGWVPKLWLNSLSLAFILVAEVIATNLGTKMWLGY